MEYQCTISEYFDREIKISEEFEKLGYLAQYNSSKIMEVFLFHRNKMFSLHFQVEEF